jgi:E3 ubiquitin-protein ligase HUWE1
MDIHPERPWRDQIALPRFTDMVPSHRGHESRTSTTDEAQAVAFQAAATTTRWQEEARMLFSGKHHEKALRIVSNLQRLLLPPAMEAKRISDAEREAAKQKAREEEEKRVAAENAAKAEKEAQEQKEREEREAKEAEEAAERARIAAEENANAETATTNEAEGTSMEGVEQSEAAESSNVAQEEQPAAEEQPTERVMTTIRGREVDITDLGIDLEFLEGLPEELREEVVMGQIAEQRAQAVQSGDQPSDLSREFLEALPPEIQRELLRQEELDRRRRQQEENRRRAAQEGNAPAAQAEEVTNADFMAMLDPGLRRTILMDSDETQIAQLPEHLQAEARALQPGGLHRRGEEFPHRRFGERSLIDRAMERSEQAARDASRQRRPIVQMLDKAGIATLLRLMFVSLPPKAKGNLHGVLSDVCKNTQNRAEVISILLSILQDGTADVNAVERSFAALSLRAKQQAAPKTPQPLKRTATGTVVTPGAELSPLNIVHACLSTLQALTVDNPRLVASFFLSEHDVMISSKMKSAKKGKGKEVRAAKFPLNALLGLLDRKIITENTSVMETLASLLNRVTHPLYVLARRAKEAEEAAKAKEEADKAKAKEDGEKAATEPSTETSAPEGADTQMAEATNVENTPAANEAEIVMGAETSVAANEESAASDHTNEAHKEDDSKTEEKKPRDPVPPEVPDENIRLVVNIITARECPSKTFQETLDVVRNLSGIPGAKEVFGRELARQAQGLSEAVLHDLEDLAKQIDSAQTETDLQGLALANFSSATAKPTKLLRVIVAMDYLFNPKANESLGVETKLKEDILAVLYEGSTFDKLWSRLSQCLTAIRVRGNLIHVATILLPLIEALMVVCRNTSLKESIADPTSPVIAGTPPPESRLESLFFKFTDDHRKLLNELIRNNHKLMYKNFDVLAKNSKVLEFDNKRNYFNRKVHTRPERTAHASLQLSVRRDYVFLDSFKSLYYKSGPEIKYGKLNIRFHGEEGIDAGGVSREWFGAMARQMFNPDYALFNPVASDRTTFHPNPLSEVNNEHLLYFQFIGRIIGKALYEGRVLDCYFSRAVYRRILGKSVSLKDMESLDLDYYKSLVWILENDITDITFETFSVDIDRFGVVETFDLVPDGRNIAVTEENKQEYVRLVVEHRLIKSVEQQLKQFLKGFHDIIPADLISIFNEQELELLISGLPEIDVDDWKNNTEYQNYQPTSPQIQWFWRAVRSFDKEEKAKLLQFVTGTSKVPLNGFKELEGMNGFAKFNIHRDYSSKEKLPSSHTCFNQLDLPEYESYEHLRQQLYTAITAGSEYFGFA